MAEQTVGEKLSALRKRSGMAMQELASAMGLAGRSSVQRFFVPHLERISMDDALKLADVWEGKGDPPITRHEITALAGLERLMEVVPNDNLAPKYMDLPRDVPVYGTAMGTLKNGGEGAEIEQAFIDYEPIEHVTRPPGYANRKGIYGIYVSGSSMEPRWDPGDPAYVDPRRPPQIGDDVIVYLMRTLGDEHEPEAILIKRLVRRSASFVELRQYNPDITFQIEMRRIKAIHRVIPKRELLAFN